MSDDTARLSRHAAAALQAGGDHEAAIAAFAAHLRRHPRDRAGWIGYGDCMVALGDAGAALLLWREAERLAPADAPLLQRLGDALAALGRHEEACIAWSRAIAADPTHDAARDALLAADPLHVLRARDAAAAPGPATDLAPLPSLLVDVSDLLDHWRQGNRIATGIQRVQIEILRAALARGTYALGLVLFDPTTMAWQRLDADRFLALAVVAERGADAADLEWRALVAGTFARLAPATLQAGATLVNLGTSWWLPDYMQRVLEAKRRHGLRYVPFLHDCIPLLVPEHCDAALVDEFARWFAGLCHVADAVLCNSRCTDADFQRLRRFVAPGNEAPTTVVPLDAAPPPATGATTTARPYVLCVGTVESRKNHLMLFHAWLALTRRYGPEAVPDLVCVGKRGWLANAALSLHANSAALRDRVQLREGVTDVELARLYRDCLFTVQNSHYEGWGLPVTESLGHGRVVLLPDHSGFRESGAVGGVFFKPTNEPDLVAKLETLIFDAGFRADAEARIARGLRLRDWGAIAASVFATASNADARDAPITMRLGEGVALRLLPGPEPRVAMALADAVREGHGWHRLEEWGVWTRPGLARLRLPVGTEIGDALRLHVELRGAPGGGRLGLRVREGAWRRCTIPADAPAFVTMDLLPDTATDWTVDLDSGEGAVLGDGRRVGVGVTALMLCRRDDLSARLDWVEGRALPVLLRL